MYPLHFIRGSDASALSTACGIRLTKQHINRLAILAGLHDAGKALALFQKKIREGIKPPYSGHLAEFISLLGNCEDIQKAFGVEELSTWFEGVEDAIQCSHLHTGPNFASENHGG